MTFLQGKKTYVTGAIMILLGIAGLTGFAPESIALGNPVEMITTGFGLIFLRNGLTR